MSYVDASLQVHMLKSVKGSGKNHGFSEVRKHLHQRQEYLGLQPKSEALRQSCEVFGNTVDWGAVDLFKGT